jgi:hypothetical protein
MGLLLRGAVFFNAPDLFDGEYPLPAYPEFQFASLNNAGVFFVPKVNDEIEVEINVDDGGFDTTDVELPEPRYRAMIYSDANDINEVFQTNYPNRMGWVSNKGHYWIMDDTDDEEVFHIYSSNGHKIELNDTLNESEIIIETAEKKHNLKFIEHAGESRIQLETENGLILEFNDTDDKITLSHQNGTKLNIESNGDWLEDIIKDKVIEIANNLNLNIGADATESVGGEKTIDVTGNCTINVGGNAKIDATGNTDIKAGGIAKVEAPLVHLNGSASPATSVQSHSGVIDLITGAPIIPTTTVFLDA